MEIMFLKIKQSGVKMETRKKVGEAITAIPAGFTPHRVVRRVYDARKKMIETGDQVGLNKSKCVSALTKCLLAVYLLLS